MTESLKGNSTLNRRQFLAGCLVCLSSAGVAACCRHRPLRTAARQLNIYSWPDYIAPELIVQFEKRFGIKVVYDTVSSNEALLAKLQAGASNYDIVVPSGYMVKQLKKLDLLSAIEKDRLPNFKNLDRRFRSAAFDPHCQYSIPYTFGTTGLGFNAAAYAERSIPEPGDWDAFWDKRMGGRMTLLDDPRETIGLSLKGNGHSYNTTSADLISQACDNLKKQKPLTMCYTSDQVIVYLSSTDGLLCLAFSGDAHQASRQNPDVKYVIPQSGTSMWIDNLCIPRTAPHPENAHLWINYMLEAEVAAQIANYILYATPNEQALRFIKSELLADKSLYPPGEVLETCEEIDDIGDAIFTYDRQWTELKCA